MQTRQHPQDDWQDRNGSVREAARTDRRGPHLREVQDEAQRVLGEVFRAARLRRGEELDAVAAKLRIRHEHLRAIEDGRFEDLPGNTYALGFLRSYAQHLGLDPDTVLAQYRQEGRSADTADALYFPEPIKEARRPRTWLVALALVLFGGVYAAWYYGATERRMAQDVMPLPERLAATSTSMPGTSTPGTSVPGASTPGVPSAPAAGVEIHPGTQAGMQPDTVSPSGQMGPPPSPGPSQFVGPAAEPSGPSAPAIGPTETGEQAPAPPPPTMLRGHGDPAYPTGRADTAVAAVGPNDWRAEPTMPQNVPGAVASAPAADTGAPENPGSVARSMGPDQEGTWSAPAVAPPNRPDRARGAGFGNLVAATQNPARTQEQEPPTEPAPSSSGGIGADQAMAAGLHAVTLHASGATWVEIQSEAGGVVFSRILQPGESYRLPDQAGLVLTTGNAGGLDIEVAGNHTGPIGAVGAVRRRISIDQLRADAR